MVFSPYSYRYTVRYIRWFGRYKDTATGPHGPNLALHTYSTRIKGLKCHTGQLAAGSFQLLDTRIRTHENHLQPTRPTALPQRSHTYEHIGY